MSDRLLTKVLRLSSNPRSQVPLHSNTLNSTMNYLLIISLSFIIHLIYMYYQIPIFNTVNVLNEQFVMETLKHVHNFSSKVRSDIYWQGCLQMYWLGLKPNGTFSDNYTILWIFFIRYCDTSYWWGPYRTKISSYISAYVVIPQLHVHKIFCLMTPYGDIDLGQHWLR